MTQVGIAEVMAALEGVGDPDRDGNLVSLGMVSGLRIKEGHVAFAIEVDAERGPRLEPLRKAAEAAVSGVPGVHSVTAVLTAEREPEYEPAKHTHSHPSDLRPKTPLMPGVRRIVAVASGKGGVGKSTVAVNLALALKELGFRVGLFDADIFGPSQPRMLGIAGAQPTSPDGRSIDPVAVDGIKAMSIGFLVPEDEPVVWRGPMVMNALEQMMRDVNWGDLDILIVDMPPGTGDTQLTMTQRVPLSGAVIVSTPQDIALLDARKGLNMFRKVDVPVLGIIENMSTYVCPNCGHEAHIFGHGGAREEAAKLETPFLGEVPLHRDIRETSDAGTPIVVAQPDSAPGKVFAEIAKRLWAQLEALKQD